MNRFDRALMAFCVALCVLFAVGWTVTFIFDVVAHWTQLPAIEGVIAA